MSIIKFTLLALPALALAAVQPPASEPCTTTSTATSTVVESVRPTVAWPGPKPHHGGPPADHPYGEEAHPQVTASVPDKGYPEVKPPVESEAPQVQPPHPVKPPHSEPEYPEETASPEPEYPEHPAPEESASPEPGYPEHPGHGYPEEPEESGSPVKPPVVVAGGPKLQTVGAGLFVVVLSAVMAFPMM